MTVSLLDIRLLCNDDDPAPGDLFIKNMRKRARRRKIKEKLRVFKPYLRELKAHLLGYPRRNTETGGILILTSRG